MKRLTIIAALSIAATITSPAIAGFVTGQDLNDWASADARIKAHTATDDDVWPSAELAGYVLGVYDGFVMAPSKANCFQHATAGQVKSIIVRYVAAHPEQWDRSGVLLATEALYEACKKNLRNR